MASNKLPHEIRDMLDDCEAVADFLQGFLPRPMTQAEGDDPEAQWVLLSPSGEPWPMEEVEHFHKWEQAIRNLKQMVLCGH